MKRIWHPYWAWESFHAGFYKTHCEYTHADRARYEYSVFLRDTERFKRALSRVLLEWPKSCEQFLSNDNINRIAWLGQAAMCIESGIPSRYRSGFCLLSDDDQRMANNTALDTLNIWLTQRGESRAEN